MAPTSNNQVEITETLDCNTLFHIEKDTEMYNIQEIREVTAILFRYDSFK